ncbi:hypothetical protein TNCV_1705681 [Trichonephila clavipes]|uniref:Uncharacterized protein n=1 Tax=Trichonephila clavipes TaxID=2585209 RepID=A0A8X6UUN0_TRICX|nr:hypothetical protein TNCV_1705681 [Trichonephila clavipes]
MNSSQHRCMNQAPASENQTQQRSLNSSLEDTVGSPLVHLGGMLLNGSTSILPNSLLQPSVTSITYGPWYTTFATSLILDGPILPYTVYFNHGDTRTVHKLSGFENASNLFPKAKNYAVLDIG